MELEFDDAYDLLGGQDMPVRQNGVLPVLRAILNVILGLSGVLGLIVLLSSAKRWFVGWREHSYKKSIRRKYGIPDEDDDPFNVAYAKVLKRRKGVGEGEEPYESPLEKDAASAQKASSVQQDAGLSIPHRRVVPPAFAAGNAGPSEGITSSTRAPRSRLSSQKSSQFEVPAAGRSVSKSRPEVLASKNATSSSQHQQSSQKVDPSDPLKRSYSDILGQSQSSVPDTPVKVAGKSGEHVTTEKIRGAKRQAASDDDISNIGSSGRKAGKRARRQSSKLQEVFSIDENDEQMDVDQISRGKKRDRAEAGSSFGGDDETSVGSRGRKSRRQKQKSSTSIDDGAQTPLRGKKRTYDAESTLGSDNDENRSKSPRKRGKPMPKEGHDASANESGLDASYAGRSIGEEWHSKGVTFKVGPDGRRMRKVLVRKRASRFSMPEDSSHPDSRARLEVLVETWLNDDQFRAAEKRGEVYVPDKGKESDEPIPFPRSGKSLLWSNQKTREVENISPTPATRIGSKPQPSPFVKPSLDGKTRRISIDSGPLIDSPTGSPSIRQSKSYSKWEKQDLEANALAKLRKQLETSEKKATTPSGKRVSFQLPPSASDSSTSSPSITSSASAPASFPGSSTASKVATSTLPPTTVPFTAPAGSSNLAKASAPSQNTSATATVTSQVNPPTGTATLPQPSNVPSPMLPLKFPTPSGSQPTASLTEKKEQATPSQVTGALGSPHVQNPRQAEASTGKRNPMANFFANSGASSNVSSSAPNGAGQSKSPFAFKSPAQGEKASAAPSPFSFGKPPEKPISAAPPALGTSAKDTAGSGTSNLFKFGSVAGGAAQTPAVGTGPKVAAPQFGVSMSKPEDSSSKPTTGSPIKFNFGAGFPAGEATKAAPSTGTAPKAVASQTPFGVDPSKPADPSSKPNTDPPIKFKLGFGANNTASPSPNQNEPAAGASKPTSSTPSFSFGSSSSATSAPTASNAATSAPNTAFGTSTSQFSFPPASQPPSGTTAPTFSFGAPAAQPTSTSQSSSTTTAPTTTPTFSFGAPAAQPPASTAPAASSNDQKSAFSTPFGQSASGSGQAVFPTTISNNTGTSNTGTTMGNAMTNGAPAPKAFTFGAPDSTMSAAPSASPFGTAGSAPAPFGTSSSSIAHALGPTPSGFGGFKTNTPTTGAPSAFGTQSSQPKPAGETTTVFKFGEPSKPTTNMSSPFNFSAGGSSTQKASEPSKPFVFGAPSNQPNPSPFGGAAAGTTNTGGNMNTNSTGFAFDAQNANTGGTGTNVFGSNSGASPFGGQKS